MAVTDILTDTDISPTAGVKAVEIPLHRLFVVLLRHCQMVHMTHRANESDPFVDPKAGDVFMLAGEGADESPGEFGAVNPFHAGHPNAYFRIWLAGSSEARTGGFGAAR